MSHVRTLEAVIHQVRIPFRPKHDPSRNLAEEIESCKRKIWECVDPAERKQYFEKKQKKINENNVKGESDKENSKHAANLVSLKSALLKVVPKPQEAKNQSVNVPVVQKPVQKTVQKPETARNLAVITEVVQKTEEEKTQTAVTRTDIELKVFVLKVAELKKELKSRGKDTSGLKKDLRARLISVMLEEAEKEQTKILPMANKRTSQETIEESNEEEVESMDTAEEKDKAVVEKISYQLKTTKESQQNDSTTSMEVEQQSKVDAPVKEAKKQLEGEVNKISVADKTSKEKKPENCQSVSDAVREESFRKAKSSQMSIKEGRISSSNERNQCSRESQGKKSEVLTETKMQEFSESQEDDKKGNPPASASEVSFASKASGTSVKDMVSKFSGFSTNHSNNNGSALSKGLQAKKEARQAKIAEMRAKAQNKPISSTKVALTSKEYSSTLSSLNAAASTASATKKNLATQMREKAAARAFQNKLPSTTSNTTMAPTNKRHLPMTNNSNNPNNNVPDVLAVKQDPLGATLKQNPLGATLKQNPLGATLKQNPLGATLKQNPLGATLKQNPLGATLKQNPLGATLKQNPLGSTLKQASSLIKKEAMSPMDTYEISDREDSETDDSDSDSDDERVKKKVPTWAQRSNLYSALEEQYNGHIGGKKVDPDEIFPEVHSCDLEAIFGRRKSKNYRSRASSGNWTKDQVTVAEKLVYKRQMGFATETDSAER